MEWQVADTWRFNLAHNTTQNDLWSEQFNCMRVAKQIKLNEHF